MFSQGLGEKKECSKSLCSPDKLDWQQYTTNVRAYEKSENPIPRIKVVVNRISSSTDEASTPGWIKQ